MQNETFIVDLVGIETNECIHQPVLVPFKAPSFCGGHIPKAVSWHQKLAHVPVQWLKQVVPYLNEVGIGINCHFYQCDETMNLIPQYVVQKASSFEPSWFLNVCTLFLFPAS